MTQINFQRHILPHLIAIMAFVVLVILFFSPVFFENQEIKQHDILQGLGGAQELIEYRKKTGEEGLWTNSMFSGMPAYLVNLQFSGDVIAFVHKAYALGLPHPVNAIFMALLSYYILLLVFGVRPYLAIGGAIAFAFSTFFLISLEAGHNSKVIAIAFMPLIMAGIHIAFRNFKLLGFAVTALGMALHLRVNHLQITYYLMLIVIIYGLVMGFFLFKEKKLGYFFKIILVLVGSVVLGLAANAGRILTLFEYSEYSIRGKAELTTAETSPGASGLDKEYAFQYSSGIVETFTLLIPHFYGGATQEDLGVDSNLGDALTNNNVPPVQIKQATENAPTYWGDQPMVSGPVYAGAIVIFLFVLGIFFADKKYIYWLVSATVLSLFLFWGKNFETFNYLMFDYFPGYNKFRAVTMSITIALFCMPLLGVLGLENMIRQGNSKKTKKTLLLSSGITGGLCLLFFLAAGLFSFQGAVDAQLSGYPGWYLGALKADREAMLRSDAFRSLILIFLAAGLIWFYLKGKLSANLMVSGISVLILIDLFTVDKRYLTEENYERTAKSAVFEPTPADLKVLQDEDISYRVINLQNPWNDAFTSYYHKSVGGYHGAKMRRYQDLITRCISPEINMLIEDFQSAQPDFEDYDILNMLNTKYLLAGTTAESVIQNNAALGNAWFVNEVIKVNSADEEIAKTCEIDSKDAAVVDISKFNIKQENYSDGSINLVTYRPNYLKYEADNNALGLAVFSEVYYPVGWKVTIDGKETEMIRANYVLRALEIPEGKHTIEFVFEPQSFTLGNNIMGAASIAIIIAFVISIYYSFTRKRITDSMLS